jgi:hypothetical protein
MTFWARVNPRSSPEVCSQGWTSQGNRRPLAASVLEPNSHALSFILIILGNLHQKDLPSANANVAHFKYSVHYVTSTKILGRQIMVHYIGESQLGSRSAAFEQDIIKRLPRIIRTKERAWLFGSNTDAANGLRLPCDVHPWLHTSGELRGFPLAQKVI